MKMKKVITILAIMMVLVGSVFATTNDTLYITSTVPVAKPEFKMYGALTASALNGITYETAADGSVKVADTSGAAATSNTLAGGNIAAADIDVFLKIFQNNKSFYKNETGFSVSVTASALTNANGGSITPTVQGDPTVTGTAQDAFQSVLAQSASTNIVTWTAKYLTGAPVAAGTVLGTCQFHYEQDENAPVGAYSATITLAYTAN